MKKSFFKRLGITAESIKSILRQALSPTFILILLGSCLLWYTSKLGHTYENIEMPLNVRIDGQKYRLTATVTGRGSTIVAQRLGLKAALNLTLDQLTTRRSRETEGARTITPASLQRAIHINDLEVTAVVDAPDFTPAPPAPPDETPKERRKRLREERKARREQMNAELEESLSGSE